MKETKNNYAELKGTIVSDFKFSHEIFGEKFYTVYVSCERLSDARDIIPVTVSERLVDVNSKCMWDLVEIKGEFRSYNKFEEDRKRLVLSLFAKEFEFVDFIPHYNAIYLNGYLCKEPVYRKTPLGREITEFILAVNRNYGKSDYIPCICWGRNARFASGLSVGDNVSIEGRMQSREYVKKGETRIAYEISINTLSLEVNEDDNEKESN